MSNVRPRNMSRTTCAFGLRRAASQEAFGQRYPVTAGALAEGGHPSVGGWRTVTARQREGIRLRWHRHAHASPDKERKCILVCGSASGAAESKRWSVRGRRCSGSGEVGAPAVAKVPLASFRSRCRGISNSHASPSRPNPSIERTHNGEAQCPAPSRVVPPLCAAHVKR
jgi:hypothetical protein